MGALRRRDSVAVVHTDAVNDLYLASLEGAYSAAFPRITRYDRGNTYFSSIVRDICEQNTSVVLYAGGPSYLPELVDALNQRPCGGLAISLATEAVDTSYLQSLSLGTNLRLLCASPVNVNDWAHVAPGTPVGYASFASAYSDRFPDPLDDGYAILHHDATATALDAVTLAYYTINHPPGPADVLIATRQLDRYHPVHGASGTLSFDSAGNPEGKPIPVVQIPKAESPIPLYQTP